MPRGRPPKHSRTQVVAAAIAVADAEGLDALTMRRLAAELDAGVMSLYTYVRDKDDLVDQMVDQISAFDPERAGTDLLDLVRWQRQLMLRHPWLPTALPNRQLTGPNMLGYLERALAALAPTGLPGGTKMEILALLTGFVASYVSHELAQAQAGRTDPERIAAHVEQLQAAVATGAYPELARVLAENAPAAEPSFDAIAQRMIKGLLSG
ncbi:TetR/AcrR family transcriptional regulator C-terminal domain-containing protein [Actinoplanes sp. NPDC048967]|uniref:TetR/AcrR family transcriptional regulator n=1 Tax=Actinoplanes sp. NPDC048967 TaxID=3155269 RepID=UPI0033D6F7E7